MRRLVADTGTVFDALSERDGQLRRLIENANRVFATTAARDRELADTFRVLPTFERESTLTVNRLARVRAHGEPARDAAAPGGAAAQPDAAGHGGARARPEARCSATSTR